MSNQTQTQTPKMSLAEKYAYGLAIAGSASMGASAAGDTVDVNSVVSSITGLGAPVAAIGGAMLTLYVVLKGWKVVRRAL